MDTTFIRAVAGWAWRRRGYLWPKVRKYFELPPGKMQFDEAKAEALIEQYDPIIYAYAKGDLTVAGAIAKAVFGNIGPRKRTFEEERERMNTSNPPG